MPEVTGLKLDVALSDIERAGFDDEVEVLGGGTFGVLDESNWQVCEQSPAAGEAVTDSPRVTVDRSCGDDEKDQAEASSDESDQEPESEPSEANAEKTLTAENNTELEALLADGDYELSEAFAAKYEGRTIAFDGSVDYMANHDDYDTRYDLLLSAGDYSETTQQGPTFKYEDVNFSDLNVTGPDAPEYVGQGDNLRFTAEVGEFNSDTGIFFLHPVATEAR